MLAKRELRSANHLPFGLGKGMGKGKGAPAPVPIVAAQPTIIAPQPQVIIQPQPVMIPYVAAAPQQPPVVAAAPNVMPPPPKIEYIPVPTPVPTPVETIRYVPVSPTVENTTADMLGLVVKYTAHLSCKGGDVPACMGRLEGLIQALMPNSTPAAAAAAAAAVLCGCRWRRSLRRRRLWCRRCPIPSL